MQLKNNAAGYGLVTKSVHWLTFGLLIAQFTIGYALDDEGGRGRGRGRSGESGRGRGRGGEDDFSFGFSADDDTLLTVHVLIGVTILVLTTLRVIWRKTTPLPAWAPTLSAGERQLTTWTERALYACLFAVPLSGLALVFVSDDLLPLHIASHIAFFAAFTVHLAIVLKHQFVVRDSLVSRML